MKNGLTIVIPALNEAKTIGPVIKKCLEVAESVLVVDDGSTDGTSDVATSNGAQVARNPRPTGYDAAISRGLNEAFARGARAAITCDADGQHRAEDVRRVSDLVLSGESDFAAGVRDHYNRPVEAMLGPISKLLFGTMDPFCGLRCYSRRFFETCGSFPADMNIGTLGMVLVKRKKLRFAYIGIHVEKRADKPRFGTFVSANLRLAHAFGRSAVARAQDLISGR